MRMPTKLFVVAALALAVGLATAVSPYASSAPDGLEKVAADQAFLDDAKPHAIQDAAPIADYAVPGVGNPRVATGAAGFAGVLAVFALGTGLAWVLRRRGRPDAAAA